MSIDVPEKWDVEIIDYWGSLLKSYHKCHEAPEEYNTTEKVTNLIIEDLPKATRVEDQKVAHKRQRVETIREKADRKPIEMNEKESESEAFHDWTHAVEEDRDEVDISDVREQETEPGEELGVQDEQRERPKEEKESKGQQEDDFADYAQPSNVPEEEEVNQDEPDEIPHQYYSGYPPQTATVSGGDDDGLSNVIMAWYYAGYYTALYQSRHGNNRHEG